MKDTPRQFLGGAPHAPSVLDAVQPRVELLLRGKAAEVPGTHCLFVYTAVPGSESYGKLQLLSVIGAQTLGPAPHDEAVALAAPPFTVG